MEIKIPKITVGIKDAIKDPEARCNRKAQEIAVKNAWAAIYTAVASGDSDIAYWGDKPVIRPGFYSFMRYALHRSPKQDGFLQLSVMEIRNGETIPTSDSQHDNVEDFISRRAWGTRCRNSNNIIYKLPTRWDTPGERREGYVIRKPHGRKIQSC